MCAYLAHAFVYEFAHPCAEPVNAMFLVLPARCRPSPARCRHGGAHAATALFAFTRRNRATRSVQPASIPPSRPARHHDQRAGHPIAIALPPPDAPSTWSYGLPIASVVIACVPEPCRSPHKTITQTHARSSHVTPGLYCDRSVAGRYPIDAAMHCMCPMLRALARLAFRSSRACGVHAASLERVRTCTPW